MTAYLTQPKELLRQMLARSVSFQAAVGATGTDAQKITAALARIHSVAIEDFDSKCVVGSSRSVRLRWLQARRNFP